MLLVSRMGTRELQPARRPLTSAKEMAERLPARCDPREHNQRMLGDRMSERVGNVRPDVPFLSDALLGDGPGVM